MAGWRGPVFDPDELLSRAQTRISLFLDRQPDFTCVQTVERSVSAPIAAGRRPADCGELLPRNLKLQWRDRLRFDIAVIGGEELFSWPGDDRFETRLAEDLATDGPFGTGDYGTFLISIFVSGVATYSYEGPVTENGRTLARYSFEIGPDESRYVIRAGADFIAVPYYGEFWVDPDTASLQRLRIRTRSTPTGSGLCEARTDAEYREARVGGDLALMPRSAKLTMIHKDAGVSENEITYAQCRHYTASSTLRFSSAETSRTPMPGGAPVFPAGTTLVIALSKRIDESTAAAGDIFEGELAQPAYDAAANIVAPKGSKIRGRVLRIQQFFAPQVQSVFAIRLDSVEWDGARHALSVAPMRMEESEGVESEAGGSARMRTRHPVRPMPLQNQLNSGGFVFAGKKPMVLEPGWTSLWKTR